MSLRWVSAISAAVVVLAACAGQACRDGTDETLAVDAGPEAAGGGAGVGGGGAGASGTGGTAGTGAAGVAEGGTPDATGVDAGPGPGELYRSPVPYDSSPDVSPDDIVSLTDGIGTFGFELFDLIAEDENAILSPQSIAMCLGMLHAGARGQTEQEMADTLRFPFPQQTLHPAFNALSLELKSRSTATGPSGSGFTLEIANGLWVQHSYPIEMDFLDVLSESYDTGVWLVDFAGDHLGVIDLINAWVDSNSHGMIPMLVDETFITADTRLAVGNALYFRAAWQSVFKSAETTDEPFTRLDGTQATVPMMHQTGGYGYAEGDGYRLLSMDYEGYLVRMLVIVPDEGNFMAIRHQLSPTWLKNAAMGGGLGALVSLAFPKFATRSRKHLKEPLSMMGMPSAFSGADFSGLTSAPFSLWDVVHEAVIDVNEDGTEAAGVTVGAGGGSSGVTPIEMVVNRPFLYVIQDGPTGAILFLGQYLGPES